MLPLFSKPDCTYTGFFLLVRTILIWSQGVINFLCFLHLHANFSKKKHWGWQTQDKAFATNRIHKLLILIVFWRALLILAHREEYSWKLCLLTGIIFAENARVSKCYSKHCMHSHVWMFSRGKGSWTAWILSWQPSFPLPC